jgi:hypothetical protein
MFINEREQEFYKNLGFKVTKYEHPGIFKGTYYFKLEGEVYKKFSSVKDIFSFIKEIPKWGNPQEVILYYDDEPVLEIYNNYRE